MNTYESDFEDSLERARALLSANESTVDLWEASELANHALSIRPDDTDAWVLKSQILSALDDDIAALAAIEMAIRRNPGSAEAHYWRSAVLADLERLEEALETVERAFQLRGEDDDWLVEDLYYEKAAILEAMGLRDQALAAFREGLAQFPDSIILKAGIEPLQRERVRASFKVIPGGLS